MSRRGESPPFAVASTKERRPLFRASGLEHSGPAGRRRRAPHPWREGELARLDPDHPGFRDAAYRERRNAIAPIALEYRGGPVPCVVYSQQENETWRAVWATFCEPGFARVNRALGEAGERVDPQTVSRVARLYWSTVEFGVCKEGGGLKAYGAGLLSARVCSHFEVQLRELFLVERSGEQVERCALLPDGDAELVSARQHGVELLHGAGALARNGDLAAGEDLQRHQPSLRIQIDQHGGDLAERKALARGDQPQLGVPLERGGGGKAVPLRQLSQARARPGSFARQHGPLAVDGPVRGGGVPGEHQWIVGRQPSQLQGPGDREHHRGCGREEQPAGLSPARPWSVPRSHHLFQRCPQLGGRGRPRHLFVEPKRELLLGGELAGAGRAACEVGPEPGFLGTCRTSAASSQSHCSTSQSTTTVRWFSGSDCKARPMSPRTSEVSLPISPSPKSPGSPSPAISSTLGFPALVGQGTSRPLWRNRSMKRLRRMRASQARMLAPGRNASRASSARK